MTEKNTKRCCLMLLKLCIGIFGFDRTLYGKPKDKKWWMELRRNRMNDMQAEADGR